MDFQVAERYWKSIRTRIIHDSGGLLEVDHASRQREWVGYVRE